MAKVKGQFELENGDVLYPETSIDKVVDENGTPLDQVLSRLSGSVSLGSLTIEKDTVLIEDEGTHPMDEADEYPYYYQFDDERITAKSMIVPVLPMSALRNGELAPFLTTFDGYARFYFLNETVSETITINDLILSEVTVNEL